MEEGGGRGEIEEVDSPSGSNGRSPPTSIHEEDIHEKNSSDLKV